MKIAIGVVTHNGDSVIEECLDSVLSQTLSPSEIAIVDNASQDNTLDIIEVIEERAKTAGIRMWRTVNPTNVGFTSGANQILIRYTKGIDSAEIVVLLNQDAYLDRDCLQALSDAFSTEKSLAVAGPKILYPDSDTIQYAGGEIEEPRGVGLHVGHHETDAGQFDEVSDTTFVTGAVIALRVASLVEVGVFDEIFSPGYYEDVDLCDRLRNEAWLVQYTPRARAWHHESSSFSDRAFRLRLAQRNRILFLVPRLLNQEFACRFRQVELAAIDNQLVPDELRALAAACLEVRSLLTRFLALRAPKSGRVFHARIADLLLEIRHRATDRLIGTQDSLNDA